MGSAASRPKQLGDACVIVVSGSGEDEVNGVYVEMRRPYVSNKSDKPSFAHAGRTRGNAAIVIWWADAGEQWSIGKFPRSSDVASTNKLWYIASTATKADVSGVHQPEMGWAVSAKAPTYAGFTIGPAPNCRVLGVGESIPADALQRMFAQGVKHAADGE